MYVLSISDHYSYAKLEEWLNRASGKGVQLANYVIRLILYVNDLILITESANGLRKNLKELEHFFQEVGMQVSTSKIEVMIFLLKINRSSDTFLFEGNPLEIVSEYKYLGINFQNKINLL